MESARELTTLIFSLAVESPMSAAPLCAKRVRLYLQNLSGIETSCVFGCFLSPRIAPVKRTRSARRCDFLIPPQSMSDEIEVYWLLFACRGAGYYFFPAAGVDYLFRVSALIWR
jgi:hypothetical protein